MRNIIYTVFALGTFALIMACGGGDSANESSGDVANGKEVYTKYCVLCHGDDGKKAVNGAKDITVSLLTHQERVTLITDGKNLMTPFKGIMTEKEIEDVAAYSMTLGK